MEQKIKILMVLGNTSRCGAQTFAVNVLRGIDKCQFQVDFVVYADPVGGYGEEIKKLGSKILFVPHYKVYNHLEYVRAWKTIAPQYDIIHGNVSSSGGIYLKVAKQCGCITIAHSHSTGYRGNWFMQLVKKLFTRGAKDYADYWFSCSDKAAIRMFGNDFKLNPHYYNIPNAINVDNYRFNENKRQIVRQRYNIPNDCFVCGHVGSFTAPKNHVFLIKIFCEILKHRPNSYLLLCGDGELRKQMEDISKSYNINNKVIFAGNVSDVAEHMMAMDVMCFPSLFEGFGIVVLEAQSTGLTSVVSDTLPSDIFLTERVKCLSLKTPPKDWAKMILNINFDKERISCNDVVSETRYNLKTSIKFLSQLYLDMYNQKKGNQ